MTEISVDAAAEDEDDDEDDDEELGKSDWSEHYFEYM
jgi:hypothetical protein